MTNILSRAYLNGDLTEIGHYMSHNVDLLLDDQCTTPTSIETGLGGDSTTTIPLQTITALN